MNSTETCMCCSYVNRIPPYRPDAFAFECWNCGFSCWFDDVSLDKYQTLKGIDYDQAQVNLADNIVPIVDGEFNG